MVLACNHTIIKLDPPTSFETDAGMEWNQNVLLDLAIAQILAIGLLARVRGMHQSPTPILRGSRQEELHNVQEPSGIAREI